MNKSATGIDYRLLQGGRPRIWQDEGGLWHIRHEYLPDAPEITTHVSPQERGTVIIDGKEFNVSELWQFEGKPCETQSKRVGGQGYTRQSSEKKG